MREKHCNNNVSFFLGVSPLLVMQIKKQKLNCKVIFEILIVVVIWIKYNI